MKTSSGKAKGRRLQNDVADLIRGWLHGCDPGDVRPAVMGESGPDILLYGKAKEQWPFASGGECKAHERLNIWRAMAQAEKYNSPLWYRRNRSGLYVSLEAKLFLDNL